MPKIGYSRRALALGRDGLVASCHPLATLAGVETLKAGGTAADAAVATNAVLAVTQSNNCGVGGDLFCLYWEAATRRVHFLNGAGRAGGRASLDELRRRGLKGLPVIGAETVSVPGVTRAWAMLLERFGRRTLDGLLQAAVHYAERGFPLTSIISQAIGEFAPGNRDAEWHRVFRPAGRAPAPGEMFVQPDLARTLRDLAAEGPDLFYRGRIARAIAERMAGEGNVAAVIQSLFNSFGSGVVPPGTGFCLQNRGRHFSVDPAHPNVLAPGKRPFHTLMASITTKEDRPVLGFATMGGNGQAMFH